MGVDMRLIGNRRAPSFAPGRVPRSRAERRDLSARASWTGDERPAVPRLASRAVAEAQLERLDGTLSRERVVARTIPPRGVADRGPNCKTKRHLDVALALIGLVV